MLQRKWVGFAGQMMLVALSLLPLYWAGATPEDQEISAFEIPVTESGHFLSEDLSIYPPIP